MSCSDLVGLEDVTDAKNRSLRRFTFTSVALVLVWSWYYLGSQAASRELAFHDSAHPFDMKMAFVSPSAPSAFDEGQPNSRVLGRTNARYLTKLGASGTHAMDMSSGWDDSREALIPVWDFEFAKVFAADSPHGGHGVGLDGWWDTDLPTYQIWSSAMGIPFLGIYNGSNSNDTSSLRLTDHLIGHVRLNTSYIQANCSEITIKDGSFHEITGTVAPTFNTILNMTNATVPTIAASRNYDGQTVTTMCNLTTTLVELEISCARDGCKTTRARPTTNQPLTIPFFYNTTLGQIFIDNMVAAIGAPAYDGEDLLSSTSKWQDARNQVDHAYQNTEGVSIPTLLLPASRGMTQVINTYLQASQQALINSTNTDALIDGVLGRNNAYSDTFERITMHGAPYAPQYRISYPWLIIDFVSCLVLLACSIFAIVLGRCTLAPDVFGYVSSLTRDNPHLNLPDGGSMMPGLERARRLKGVKVQIVDVGEGVGRVGLTVAGSGREGLRKGKEFM